MPPHASTPLTSPSPADISGFFDDLDLTELTRGADASRPEHGVNGPRT
ncbi:hypothetical protein [Streptomyces fagopyri]